MNKKIMLFIIMFLITLNGALAIYKVDNFNDGSINGVLWNFATGSGTCTLEEYAPITETYSNVTVYATRDNYLNKDQDTTNYGTANPILIGRENANKIYHSILFFVDVETFVNISNSTLKFYVDSIDNPFNMTIHRLTTNWTHYGSDWLTYDGSNSWTTEGGDYDSEIFANKYINETGAYEIVITDLVNGWVNDSFDNYGLLLKHLTETSDDQWLEINSIEDSNISKRPQIWTEIVNRIESWDGYIEVDCDSGLVYLTTKTYRVGAGIDAEVEAYLRLNTSSVQNEETRFCVAENVDIANDCGYCVVASYFGYGGQMNKWTATRGYPANEKVANCGSIVPNQWEKMRIDVTRLLDSNITQYEIYFNDSLCLNATQTADCSNPDLNASLVYHSTSGNSKEARFDDFSMYTTQGEDTPECVSPCVKNETFAYSDSLCNHNGWIAGDCNDLNPPINNQYVCNESDEVLAKYFGLVTKDSLYLTMEFDLEIKSDYDLILGLGSQDSTTAILIQFDNGIIRELRDNNQISSYDYEDQNTYRIVFDLHGNEYDFYRNDILQNENVPFYNNVDNLYYFFLQPDYVKGYQYCDYVLDNVLLTRGIIATPVLNETNFQFGCLNLDPSNASFNYECCLENEHPQVCFWRANFEYFGNQFANYFFGNFLIFLVIIIVLIVIVLLREQGRNINIFNRK